MAGLADSLLVQRSFTTPHVEPAYPQDALPGEATDLTPTPRGTSLLGMIVHINGSCLTTFL